MTFVQRLEGEGIDSLVRRFVREMIRSGVMREVRRRRYALSPSEHRRQKANRAAKRRARAARMQRRRERAE